MDITKSCYFLCKLLGGAVSSMVQRPIKNLIFLIGADFGTPSPGRLYGVGGGEGTPHRRWD